MSFLTQIPAVAEKLGETISGLAVNYRHSPIIEDHAAGNSGPAAGDRAPDAPLSDAKRGAALRLYDLVDQHRHVLLLMGNAAETSQIALPRYPEGHVTVHRIAAPGTPNAQLIDREGIIAARYGSAPAAYLIRPDGYIGFRCGLSDVPKHLPRYLAELFRPASPASPS